MNQAQLATLKAYILSQPDLAPISSGASSDYQTIANLLNANATPETLAWLTAVDPSVIDDAPNYANFDTIQAGKRDSWGFMLARSRDFTRNKTRKWVTDIWGNATAGSDAEAILLAATEKASRAEVALGGSTKTTGTVSALDRDFVGELSVYDINAAMSA